jgi:hypothetical protein
MLCLLKLITCIPLIGFRRMSNHWKEEKIFYNFYVWLQVRLCHGFTTGFESRGAHGCEEQWNVRDIRV